MTIKSALAGTFLLLAFLFIPFNIQSSYAATQNAPVEKDLTLHDLAKTIEAFISAEIASVEDFRTQLAILNHEKLYFAAAINGYQLRVSTYESLLLTSGIAVESIQEARTELQASMKEVQKLIDEMKPRLEIVTTARGNISQQKILIKKQVKELGKIENQGNLSKSLQTRAKELNKIIAQKEKLIEQLEQIITFRIDHITQLSISFSSLSGKFESAIVQLKKQHLFERRKSLFTTLSRPALQTEITRISTKTKNFIRDKQWQTDLKRLWHTSGNELLALMFILIVALALLKRATVSIAHFEAHAFIQQLGPCHRLVFKILSKLLIPTGFTLILYACAHIEALYLSAAGFRLLAYLLSVAIVTRLVTSVLTLWPWEVALPQDVTARLVKFATSVQYFCWFHLLVNWSLGSASILLLLFRITFVLGLLAWLFNFWKSGPLKRQIETGSTPYGYKLKISIKALGYLIGGTALFLDVIGYGTLSVLWMLSWARSLIVCLCWMAFFLMLQEWDQYYRQKSTNERDELLHDEYPIQWLMIRAGQFCCAISLVIVLILAWGGQQAVLFKIYSWLGYQLKIGNMSFSALGLIYSILVLLGTHALARLWRWIFQTKFLNRSGMAVGLQDSITTITIYALWILGVTISMHVFGLNTATLAVALGALGVGLGFGLQNIFNNFISGIILLFERPIQVGDDVEINGTWATVKRINVRSTVVQSYDNASLIIPNSEFISSQVTNWSFKDKRLRRKITVGVAYGSNINLVRETLLEIAGKTPRVLKRPEPDVLFTDFGDSALIFKLRIWTDIDHMLKVETAIRFEIDRLFDERNIVIAFPQQDIHIRSTVPEEAPQALGLGHKPGNRSD